MPTTATLDGFKKAIENIKIRRGVVVFCNASDYTAADLETTPSGLTLYTAGIIKDMNLGGDPVEFGPDTQGRTFVKGFNTNLAYTLMQTGADELSSLPAIMTPSGNGLYVALCDDPFPIADPATGITYEDIAAVDKIEMLNVNFGASLDINFNRDESGVETTSTGFIPVSELSKLYTEPLILG